MSIATQSKNHRKLADVIKQVHPELKPLDNNTAFEYQTFMLPGETQARIFRVQRSYSPVLKRPLPQQQGRYVAATITLRLGRLLLAFSEFPEGGGESVQRHMLEYDAREYDKVAPHVVAYLAEGKIPTADGEYDPSTPTGPLQ